MVHEALAGVISSCRRIAGYLPDISHGVNPGVAKMIQEELHTIELLTKHIHEGELAAISLMLNGGELHAGSPDGSPVSE